MRNLFIGNQKDYDNNIKYKTGWKIIHACKEPYHRKAVKYTGRAIYKNHPEYLIAYRGHRLILNLIDIDDPKYIPKEIIDEALKFIKDNIQSFPILLHCNKGESRSPSIGMLYMSMNNEISNASFGSAFQDFIKIYPEYKPANGIKQFLVSNWEYYCTS